MKNIKITVGTCAYLSHAFKYVCSQYGVTSCQGEHKMKIRSLSVLVAMILLIGCYSPVAKVDAAEKNYKKEYQKIVKESYKENPGCTYNLIYINKDDIPELVVSNPNDYTVRLYTYCKGKLGTVIENWSYGMGGAIVYEYLPHKNVICIQGCDIADTWTESYYKINKMELVSKQSLTTYNFKDKNHNGVLDPDEADTYSSKPVEYYKDGQKISKKEYKKILIKGKYKNMIGQKTYQQILKKLK